MSDNVSSAPGIFDEAPHINALEPEIHLYEKADFVSTKLGNKINKKSVLCGSDKICVLGKSVIEQSAIIRGDLAQVTIGHYCIIGESSIIRAPDQLFQGEVLYIPLTIGDFCIIERNAIIQAASIGNNVRIGENSIVGKACIIKECVEILPHSVVAPGTVVPPFTVYGGTPAKFVRRLPNAYQLSLTEHCKSYYHSLKPKITKVVKK